MHVKQWKFTKTTPPNFSNQGVRARHSGPWSALDYVQISTLNSISEDLNFSEFKALTSLMIVKFNSQETASAIHFYIDAVQSIM